ncbi:MAG: hypothetical protein DELT_02850 [Desulfovibrio sp.]
MKIMDYLLLSNVRKEPYFFWCRLVIGTVIALSIHSYGAVDPQQVIMEIKGKQILLVLLTIALCIPMTVTRFLKPRNRHIHSFQKAVVEVCKASLMVIRGALVMGIAVIFYCMVAELDKSLALTLANFLLALELATSTYAGLDSFAIPK